MGKHTLIIKKNDCMGCHACEVACKQEHDLKVGPRLIHVIEKSPDFIPVYCRQCAKPPCRDVCLVDAISRNESGIVLIDNDLCIGCRECIEVCPFGAMQYEEELEAAVKCDLCLERLESGKKPACLSVCPTGCIALSGDKGVAAVFER